LQFLLAAFLPLLAAAQVEFPEASQADPIAITAQAANHWQQGAYEVWLLRGNCRIGQGQDAAWSNEAVLWIDRSETSGMAATPLAGAFGRSGGTPNGPGAEFSGAMGTQPHMASWKLAPRQPTKVIAYLEGNVVLEYHRGGKPVRLTDRTWFGRFYSLRDVQVQAGAVARQPDVLPGIYQRGMEQRSPAVADVTRRSEIQPTQYAAPAPEAPVGQPLPPGQRRIRVFARGDVPFHFDWLPPTPPSNQWIAVIDQGVNLLVDGLSNVGPAQLQLGGSIDVSTDRLVVWTNNDKEPDFTGQTLQSDQNSFEIYMEGNIVFRQGDRVIYANRMYYDVRNRVGTVLDAEMLIPGLSLQGRQPTFDGMARLHAQVLQQTGPDRFTAQNAFITPSRLGVPRFRLESGQIEFEDVQHPGVDPVTGEPKIVHERSVKAQNNLLYLEDAPIFYWPTVATDLEEPTFYLRRIKFKSDSVFGTQVLTNWNMFQLLGVREKPQGTDWDLSLDYMSKRGFGHGTTFLYNRPGLLGLPGPTSGLAEYWGIFDNGFDNLGNDRSHLEPETDYRYRFLWQHRQRLPEGYQITAEAGKISDRNFLQEYFKQEWDELKDQTTDIELRRTIENRSWNIFAQYRLNEFFTETNWLPRFDHFMLGQSLWNDTFTWHEHSSLGFAQFNRASQPTNPQDTPFNYPAWESGDFQGERLITRHEFDWPFQFGAVKFVPYALGELGHWGQDINGEQLNRAYYQAGLRATLPMWSVDPTVESALWNVHGLAHKVEFDAEYWFSQSNRRLGDMAMYDSLDDNNIEAWRRRLASYTFGVPSSFPPTALPVNISRKFDPRYYALRSDMQGLVTAPSMEIADNLTAFRLGVHQRWQTKRGPPDCRHIVDWITLDTNLTLYPDPGRDNFEQVLGLWDYDFTWHVGDRLSLLSQGMFDFFGDGQKMVSVGAFLNRPPRSSLYAGLIFLDGPISNQIFNLSYNYWMSPKWISTLGTSMAFGPTSNFFNTTSNTNIGEYFRITRVGESLLISLGVSWDPARSTYGTTFAIEPRLQKKGRLGQVAGAHVPAAGAYGLE
jgi:lipopolysaccharide export system protein LptA